MQVLQTSAFTLPLGLPGSKAVEQGKNQRKGVVPLDVAVKYFLVILACQCWISFQNEERLEKLYFLSFYTFKQLRNFPSLHSHRLGRNLFKCKGRKEAKETKAWEPGKEEHEMKLAYEMKFTDVYFPFQCRVMIMSRFCSTLDYILYFGC